MTHEDFIQAILAEPDDDTPRLIFADWLEERGDPRGEFIRVQCELAKLIDPYKNWPGMYGGFLPAPVRNRKNKDRAGQLRARQLELLMAHSQKWVGPLGDEPTGLIFERGFVEGLNTEASVFLANAAAWYRAVPLRQLCLRSGTTSLGLCLGAPFLRHLHTLDLTGGDNLSRFEGGLDNVIESLAACPYLANLRRLHLAMEVGQRGATALLESSSLKKLKCLRARAENESIRSALEARFGPLVLRSYGGLAL